MQYHLVALFAVAAIAAPIKNGDDVNIGTNLLSDESTGAKNAKREENGFIADYAQLASDIANAMKRSDAGVASDGGTGVKNSKRAEDGLITDYVQLADDIANAMKRSDEGLISDLNVGTNVGSDDSTGVTNAKRAEDVSIGGVEAGTPIHVIENAKRDEDLSMAPITIGAISL
ncbi:hypothetical protein N7520_005160 [Penicillium odoratum]|uniref:uncharacterized protein n=1 Tax=Penicillium odoratum TaxID=1167516 RepID=UPI002546DBD6|nr:uncharacterized protein N7520_005160 [Penicillium odoratum]KAJ5765601.1 hypothetical protein N7520_005160 [Penicillium odoratum]